MIVSVTCAEFWGKRMRQSRALFKVFRGHPVWGGEQVPTTPGTSYVLWDVLLDRTTQESFREDGGLSPTWLW